MTPSDKTPIRKVGPDLAARSAHAARARADQRSDLETIRARRTGGSQVNEEPLDAVLDAAERDKAIWLRLASSAIDDLRASGREFSADDVRAAMPHGLEPHHPNAWGALFNSYRREQLIELAGYRQSTTTSRNGGVLRMWRGREPDPADPGTT